MQSNYGCKPLLLKENLLLAPSEFCFVQYMPIKMADISRVAIPDYINWIRPLVDCIKFNLKDYAYATVKHSWVDKDKRGNRTGWHSDGFMTDDINYIWYDSCPTDFCIQNFEITEDCDASLLEMEQQARIENIINYPCNSLLCLDKGVIHRVAACSKGCYRAFIKISTSRNKYNLKGNAHNHLFDYEWEMHERNVTRNHPTR